MPLYSDIKKQTTTGSGLYSARIKKDKEEEKQKQKDQEKIDITYTQMPSASTSTQNQDSKSESKPWYLRTGWDTIRNIIEGTKKSKETPLEEKLATATQYREQVGGQPMAYIGSRAEEGLLRFNQGLWNAAAAIANNIAPGSKIAEELKRSQSGFENWININAELNQPVSSGQKLLGDVTASTAQMMPSLLIRLINPIAGDLSFGIPAAGLAAREAELEGASTLQQLAYGASVGAIETAIEKIAFFKPLEKLLPKGAFSNLVKTGSSNMQNNLKNIITDTVKAIAGEAFEEAIADPISGLAKKIIYDRDKPWFGEGGVVDPKEMAYDALVGGITGGIFSLPTVPFNISDARAAKKYIEENYDATLIVAQGLPAEYESHKKAVEYTKNAYPISYNELIDLQNQVKKDVQDYSKKVKEGKIKLVEPESATEAEPASGKESAKTPTQLVREAAGITEAVDRVPEAKADIMQKAEADTTEKEAQKPVPKKTDSQPAAEAEAPTTYKVGDTVAVKTGDTTQNITITSVKKSSVEGFTEDGKTLKFAKQSFEQSLTTETEQKDVAGKPAAEKLAEENALEEEVFGEKLPLKIDLQYFAEKMKSAREKLLEEFKKEKEAIRWLAKEKQAEALDKLSQKYEAKIEKLNKLLDAEKYKAFWKNELDKKELRDRIEKLRTQKNDQIAAMKKAFSEKLKRVKKEYILKKYEAIGKLKAKIRDAAEAERAKALEKAEIGRKFEKLKKIDVKHMRPEYKRQVEALLASLDLTAKTHTAKKLDALAKLKKYIEEHPDHSISEKVLKQLDILSKKTVNELTKEEFDDIYNSVMHLVHLEKLKNKLIMKGRYREAAEIAEEATNNILKNKKIKTDATSIDTSKPEMSRKFVREFFMNHLNPETLAIMSDQQSSGIIKKVLFDDMYEGHSAELKYKQDAYTIFKSFLEGLGGNIRSWSRSFNKKIKSSDLVEIPIKKQPKQDITSIKVTKAERIYLYLASKDADALRSMFKGGVSFGTNLSQVVRLTPEDINTIVESMTPEEKQFADLAEKYFLDYARPLMNEIFLELNGYELIPQRKGYVPIKRHKDFLDRDYLKMRNKSVNLSLEGIGLLKERVKASTPIVADDIFRVLVEHIEKIGAYYGLAKPLRNAKMLLENPNFKNAYRRTGMYDVYQQLQKYIEDVESGSVNMEFLDRLSHSIRSKFATSVLGANPFTILKQFSAYILELNEIPAKYLLKAQFTKNAINEIVKYSPILANRVEGNISFELGEIGKIAQIRKIFGNYKDIPQLLTQGLVKADRQIIAKTWNAVKMMLKEKNQSLTGEELLKETARKTEEIIRHTNSASTLYDRSAIGRSKSSWTRALTMFTSQTNVMFNSVVRAVMEYNQSEKTAKDFAKVSKKLVTTLVIANLVEQAIDRLRGKITGKGDDEEDDKWNIPMDIVEGILNQVYFAGKIFSAYRSNVKYGKYFGYDMMTPELQVTRQLIDYITDITTVIQQVATKERYKSGENKGKLKYKKTLTKLVDETFSILSKLIGVSYDTPKKLITGIVDKIKD